VVRSEDQLLEPLERSQAEEVPEALLARWQHLQHPQLVEVARCQVEAMQQFRREVEVLLASLPECLAQQRLQLELPAAVQVVPMAPELRH